MKQQTSTSTAANNSPALGFDDWVRWIATTKEQVASSNVQTASSLGEILARLQRESVMLTFGGHFKAGKSTLLNSLLRRQLLPAGDLPETGVICYIKTGLADDAQVSEQAGPRLIACTTEAIEKETTLLSATGEYRALNTLDALYLTLKGAPIPAGVYWVDSPGINDVVEMDVCAHRAARSADLLLWVLSSKQMFSEIESEFLERHVAERGPDSVILLLNLFLPDDSPAAWEKAREKYRPLIASKIRQFALRTGYGEAWEPPVIIVSGRALNLNAGFFGGHDLRNTLAHLSSTSCARIQKVRADDAVYKLKKIVESLRTEASAAQRAQDKKLKALSRVASDRSAFLKEAGESLDFCLSTSATSFTEAGIKLFKHAQSTATRYDDTYAKSLTASLNEIVKNAVVELVGQLSKRAPKYRLSCSPNLHDLLVKYLSPGPVPLVVPSTSFSAGTIAKGAGMGAAAGTVIPVIGTIFGSIIGAGAALVKSVSDSVKEDLILLEAEINRVVSEAGSSLRKKQAEALNLIAQCASHKTTVEQPDFSRLQSLNWEIERCEWLIKQAERFQPGEIS